MLKEIAMHTSSDEEEPSYTKVNCYLGTVHLSPVARLLNTYNSDGIHSNVEYGGEEHSGSNKVPSVKEGRGKGTQESGPGCGNRGHVGN